jgi:hypothetical protein
VDNRLDDLSDDDYPEEPPEVRRMREQSLDTNTTTDDETPPIKRGNIKAESTSSKGDNENTQTASTESRTKEIVESPKAKNEDEEFAGERIMPSLEVTVATAVPLDTPFNGNNGQNLLLEAGTSNELELIENDIVNNKNNSDKTAQQNIGIPNILVIDDARKEDMEQVANEMRQYGELHYKAAVTIQKHWRR